MCAAHGGSAPQVRAAAQRRLAESDIRRAADAAITRWQREVAEWQAKRIATASALLGMPVSDFIGPGGVNEALISWCVLTYGRPAPLSSKPKLRADHRFRALRSATHGGAT